VLYEGRTIVYKSMRADVPFYRTQYGTFEVVPRIGKELRLRSPFRDLPDIIPRTMYIRRVRALLEDAFGHRYNFPNVGTTTKKTSYEIAHGRVNRKEVIEQARLDAKNKKRFKPYPGNTAQLALRRCVLKGYMRRMNVTKATATSQLKLHQQWTRKPRLKRGVPSSRVYNRVHPKKRGYLYWSSSISVKDVTHLEEADTANEIFEKHLAAVGSDDTESLTPLTRAEKLEIYAEREHEGHGDKEPFGELSRADKLEFCALRSRAIEATISSIMCEVTEPSCRSNAVDNRDIRILRNYADIEVIDVTQAVGDRSQRSSWQG